MKWFNRTPTFTTTLPVSHPLNYLGVDADPVVLYLPILGQVVILVEAPAPQFIHKSDVYVEGRKCFALQDVDVIPSAYYKRDEKLDGYVKA